ncbi:MAG: PLP-dependent cysteine synthase family protein [Acidimicrobiales bacterium]
MAGIAKSVLELIGDTPMVEVSQLSPNPAVRFVVKLDGRNPGGSIKDRAALAMVEQAEADGLLRPGEPGQVLLEPSSGNTGIGLALVAKMRGYRLKVVLPTSVSIERRQLLEIWGAEIIESPGEEGSNGAIRMALDLSEKHPEWTMLYQYGNEANPQGHYRKTGPEIWRDCPEVTHLVAGLGTSGTLLGVGRYLKEKNPEIEIWAVEPPAGEKVDGLRNLDEGYVPPVFERLGGAELLSRKTVVRARESLEATRRLLSEAGLFVGISTGAALAGAIRCAKQIPQGESAVIVIISADDGWKYLSTGLWTDDIDVVTKRAESIIYF